MAHAADGAHKAPRTALPPSLTESSRPDPQGMLLTAFYVAANGFGAECGGLLCTCVELGHDEGEESVLRGVMTWERKAVGRGERVRPRLCHAAMVGDVSRLQRLVRAGAWLMGTEEQGFTALMVAVSKQRVDVVRELLACEGADGAFVGARIAAGKANEGHSAFSLACGWARNPNRKRTEGERAGHATIPRLLVASGRVGPGDLGGSDSTALFWACEAGLPDVVTMLLADARCTAAIVVQRSADGHSVFSIACGWALDPDSILTEGERAAYTTMARLVIASGHVGPGDLWGSDATALQWACYAGLPDVVTTLLSDARCTTAIVAHRSADGGSAFSFACSRARDLERELSEGERAAHGTIARLLVSSGRVGPGELGGSDRTALFWACKAGLPDVVTTLLTDARCTAAVVAQRDAYGHSPFSAACGWARDSDRKLTEGERAAFATIARLLIGSGHVGPGDLGGSDATAFFWACHAGLPDVITGMLASPLCTRAVVIASDDTDDSAFSAACLLAADTLDGERKFSVLERTAGAACARALAASPHLSPADTALNGRTALASACNAGLANIVTAWLADARCTEEVVLQREEGEQDEDEDEDEDDDEDDDEQDTAASLLFARGSLAARLTPTKRRDTAACARALGGCPHVPQEMRHALKAVAAMYKGGWFDGSGAAAQRTG